MTLALFDHPPATRLDDEDQVTLAAIGNGIAQLDAGRGVPLEDLRLELAKRCSR